jgi:hypothetical protein
VGGREGIDEDHFARMLVRFQPIAHKGLELLRQAVAALASDDVAELRTSASVWKERNTMPAILEIPFPSHPYPIPSSHTSLEPPLVWVEPCWEYHHVVRPIGAEEPLSKAELNTLGAAHWELTGVVLIGEVVHYYFKRAATR